MLELQRAGPSAPLDEVSDVIYLEATIELKVLTVKIEIQAPSVDILRM